MRLYRLPFSTNVERVALALAHKGIAVTSVEIDPGDRSEVERVSGQLLVPVLEDDGRVVADSTAILEYLEERYPQPPLYPREPARRAEVTIFVDWFNRVWKRWPNSIEASAGDGESRAAMAASLELFEALLDGRDYLFGEFSAADCAAFPFLKYGAGRNPADDELFHRILADNLPLSGHPRVEAWIHRVDAHPRA
jgi:glutathione S-transferase